MKAFAELYRRMDETTSTNRKVDAMVDYFRQAPAEDAIAIKTGQISLGTLSSIYSTSATLRAETWFSPIAARNVSTSV